MLRYGSTYVLAIVSALLLCGLVRTSQAEVSGAYGMKVGSGSRLILGLDVGSRYSSNFFYQESNEESVIGLVVRPSALLMTDRGALRYQLGAYAEAGALNVEGDADDYVDGQVSGSFEWNPLTRHRFSGGAYWRFDHDPFGTRRTEAAGLFDRRLDRWEQKGANAVYRFGAPDATVNLETELSVQDREYQTNRDSTQFLDYQATALRGTAYYKISSKTQLLAEVIGADIDYDNVPPPPFASRSAEVIRYRVGARWLATGKTTGNFRVGRLKRDFDTPAQADHDSLDWQIDITWEPRSRDKFRFSTGRETEESFINQSRAIDRKFYDLNWKHDWTSMFSTTLSFGYDDLDFLSTSREDDLRVIRLDLDYKPSRHWSVFADIAQRERDSNVVLRDYETTVITTGIRLKY